MEPTLFALAPAVPTSGKVGITVIMFAFAFGLTASFGKRRVWKPVVASLFLIISVGGVFALDLCFPDPISPGLDGRGVLAALIGLAIGGVSVPWSTHKVHQK